MNDEQAPDLLDTESDSSTPVADGDSADVSELQSKLARLQRKLREQREQIESLARGREEGMATINDLRAELRLVSEERDSLRKQLTSLESMQVETMVLDESEVGDETDAHRGEFLSIDDLMSSFSGEGDVQAVPSHANLSVEPTETTGRYQEMIAPEAIVLGPGGRERDVPHERYLVLLQDEENIKCVLDQDLLTIGRSDSADIKIDADFISRIHARILRIGMDSVIEDAGSRNGTWVNGRRIERHVLEHGDIVRIGGGNLRFVDTGSEPE